MEFETEETKLRFIASIDYDWTHKLLLTYLYISIKTIQNHCWTHCLLSDSNSVLFSHFFAAPQKRYLRKQKRDDNSWFYWTGRHSQKFGKSSLEWMVNAIGQWKENVFWCFLWFISLSLKMVNYTLANFHLHLPSNI